MSDESQTQIEVESEPLKAEIVNVPPASPERDLRALFESDPEIMAEVRHYHELLAIDYKKRVTDLETFLGFMESAEDLGVRLSRLESFVGIKRS